MESSVKSSAGEGNPAEIDEIPGPGFTFVTYKTPLQLGAKNIPEILPKQSR